MKGMCEGMQVVCWHLGANALRVEAALWGTIAVASFQWMGAAHAEQ